MEHESVTVGKREPHALVERVERLLAEIERLPDPAGQQKAMEVVQALFDLYGTGLERIVDEVAARDGGELAESFARDELVSHLLLLHGLHPVSLDQRVASALEEVRPYLESHGGDVELAAIEEDTVRLLLKGSCSGCPSSTMTLKLAIENAIHKWAPEIEEIVADEEAAAPDSGLLQIELASGMSTTSEPGMSTTSEPGMSTTSEPGMSTTSEPGISTTSPKLAPAMPDASPTRAITDADLDGEWVMAGGLPELAGGGIVVKPVGGQQILFLRAAERLYGYRPFCPTCQESLDTPRLQGGEIQCSRCGNRYDALRAGRCLDAPQLHLEPVPLLAGADGLVKVALPVAA